MFPPKSVMFSKNVKIIAFHKNTLEMFSAKIRLTYCNDLHAVSNHDRPKFKISVLFLVLVLVKDKKCHFIDWHNFFVCYFSQIFLKSRVFLAFFGQFPNSAQFLGFWRTPPRRFFSVSRFLIPPIWRNSAQSGHPVVMLCTITLGMKSSSTFVGRISELFWEKKYQISIF